LIPLLLGEFRSFVSQRRTEDFVDFNGVRAGHHFDEGQLQRITVDGIQPFLGRLSRDRCEMLLVSSDHSIRATAEQKEDLGACPCAFRSRDAARTGECHDQG
jgi:hypothetical protein